MADNKGVTPGTGATFATDEIGGVDYPRVKIGWGPDGTFNDTDTASGKGLPVVIGQAGTNAVVLSAGADGRSNSTTGLSVHNLNQVFNGSTWDRFPGNTSGAFVITQAGENHIGEVGGNTNVVSVTPTVSASPDYSSDDCLGSKMTITNAARVSAGSGVINFVSLSSKVDLIGPVRVVFFKSDPSATTFTDNSAVSINSADYDKILGYVDLLAEDKADLGTPNIIQATNLNIPFKLASGTSLYAAALARAAENLGSTSDLTFNFGILRD